MGRKKQHRAPDSYRYGNAVKDRLFDASLDLFKLPLPLKLPEPVYDWVQISIRCIPNKDIKILPFFVARFGAPDPQYTEAKGIFSRKFANGMRLSQDNYYYWYVVQFKASDELFLEIKELYDAILSIYPTAEISFTSAEIAFDMKFPGKSKDEIFELLQQINLIAHPNNHIVPRRYVGGECKQVDDEVINGEITIYDGKSKKYHKAGSEKDLKRTISRKQKIYTKEISGIWNIRFEATLAKESLDRYATGTIPRSKHVNDGPKQVKLTDFYNFGVFDYDSFKKAASEIAPRKHDKYGDGILRGILYGGNTKTTTSKIYRAYRAMKYIDDDDLRKRHRSGEFYHPIKLFDE